MFLVELTTTSRAAATNAMRRGKINDMLVQRSGKAFSRFRFRDSMEKERPKQGSTRVCSATKVFILLTIGPQVPLLLGQSLNQGPRELYSPHYANCRAKNAQAIANRWEPKRKGRGRSHNWGCLAILVSLAIVVMVSKKRSGQSQGNQRTRPEMNHKGTLHRRARISSRKLTPFRRNYLTTRRAPPSLLRPSP